MIVLGVETTAHTFGVGIIKASGDSVSGECTVLSNVTDSYSSPDKGMIPNEIADHHNKVALDVLAKAIKEANINWDDIDLMTYSAGPGIDPVLWAGFHKAKSWAQEHDKKLVQANHCAAHLSIGKVVNNAQDPVYLYVSGVNTQVLIFDGGKYRVIGETLDIGMGNMFDKFGRILGLGFPAGKQIDMLAKSGKYVTLPYTVKGMDTSFSGLLTRCTQLYRGGVASREDLCFSLCETAFAMAAEIAERALAHTDKKELILVGGVGASKRFCQILGSMCNARSATFYNVPMSLAGDQGAMIAWEGYLRRNEAKREFDVNPVWRTDEV
jgi:N6-L-threonylcarbamoyladenine synthase